MGKIQSLSKTNVFLFVTKSSNTLILFFPTTETISPKIFLKGPLVIIIFSLGLKKKKLLLIRPSWFEKFFKFSIKFFSICEGIDPIDKIFFTPCVYFILSHL